VSGSSYAQTERATSYIEVETEVKADPRGMSLKLQGGDRGRDTPTISPKYIPKVARVRD
jgi:hypothetical protein